MEACATGFTIAGSLHYVVSFKTVNGMEACATVGLIDGVATPRNSSFWKVIWKSPLFDCVLLKINQMSFIKVLILLSWRAPFVLENVLINRRHCVGLKHFPFLLRWNCRHYNLLRGEKQ